MRDYHRRNYGNPLFANANARGRKRGGSFGADRRIWLPAAAFIVAAAFVWIVIWSPALTVTEIEVTGASAETESLLRETIRESMKRRSVLVFPRSNIVLFSAAETLRGMQKTFYFDSISLRKKLPHTIAVNVKEKDARAVLVSGTRLFALDNSGFVIRELTNKEIGALGDLPPEVESFSTQGLGAETIVMPAATAAKDADAVSKQDAMKRNKNALPVVIETDAANPDKTPISPGSEAVTAAALSLILEANARLPDIAGTAIRWFTAPKNTETVDVTMAPEWHVFLTTALPFDVQAERLSIVLKEKFGGQINSLDYIDLRYNERIFYRRKDSSGQPKP